MNTKKLELTPTQLATIIVMDSCCVALKTGSDQLGGFLGLKTEANILYRALTMIQGEKEKLIQDWQRAVVPVPAGVIINGETIK